MSPTMISLCPSRGTSLLLLKILWITKNGVRKSVWSLGERDAYDGPVVGLADVESILEFESRKMLELPNINPRTFISAQVIIK